MIFLQFSDFDIFLSTKFAENMNSAIPSNRILPYFEEVLVNAISLQNYGDFGMDILRKKSYVPLNSEKCIQNLKKYQKKYFVVFY